MKAILTRLFNHEELTSEETKQILLNITKEMYPEAQIAALLTAFQMRSITVDELIGFREALMETRLPIDFAPYRPIDIVGTGGDGAHSFNISTTSAIICAAAGLKIAKHGYRAASSDCGTADCLEALGVNINLEPEKCLELLEKAEQTAREKNLRYHVGNVMTSDIFYGDCENETAEWKKMGVLAVEMETAALYMTAARAGKQALSITTVSDLPLKGESTSSEERQKTFTQMMEVALTVASEAVDGHDK